MGSMTVLSIEVDALNPSSPRQNQPSWSAQQLKKLLERCTQPSWTRATVLMDAHDIRMCRRSSTR
jgi:hypothetical protein